jgi:MFS family permease
LVNKIDEINKLTARSLKIFEYAAVSLLSITVITHLARLFISKTLVVIGIGFMAIAPLAGVITTGILSVRSGRRRLFYISIIIVGIYILAFLVAR